MLMQYGLLHRTLAVAVEIFIALNLLDILHLHDFNAITFLHLSILMQETSMADAIVISHQNVFDTITFLHLSILMQETTDSRCNSELSHRTQQTDVTRLLHLELLHRLTSNAKLMLYQAITSILALLHHKFAGATESKISSVCEECEDVEELRAELLAGFGRRWCGGERA
jgi:VIT1/CCC1 family predicted Fe2+/Mn2+ transporter